MSKIKNILAALFVLIISLPLLAQTSVNISAETVISAGDADISVSGDWDNNGTLHLTDSRLIFNGSGDQILYDSVGNSLPQLVLAKSGGTLFLADTVRILDSLSLYSGKLVPADTSLLILLAAAGVNGSDSSSFVNGPMAKVFAVSAVADTFRFPIGAQLDFRPLTIHLSDVSNDSLIIRAEQINDDAKDLSNMYDDLDRISSVRYWHVAREGEGSFTDAQITLTYGTESTDDGVEIAEELRVAYLDTSDVWTWYDLGGTATIDYAGRIKSNAFNDLGSGYFTFGDAAAGADISLPVVLSSFKLNEERGEVSLAWRTESEINNLYWNVERKDESDSTGQFETVTEIEGQLTTSSATDYTFADNQVEIGKTYAYRLTDVSVSGRRHVHDTVSITVGLPRQYQLHQNYPNPFNAATTIAYDLPVNSEVNIELFNIVGQKVATLIKEKQKPGYYKLIWNSTNLHGNPVASGMYIVSLRAEGFKDGKAERYQNVKKVVLVK